MLSSFDNPVFIFGKCPKEKGKDPHQFREGGQHRGNGKSGTSACCANSNFVEDYDDGDDTVERADTHRTHSDPCNFGSDGRDEVLGCAVYEKDDTFSPDVLQTGRTTILTQKLAYSWSKPKNELTFHSERRKVRAKARASFLFVHHVRHWIIADNGLKN